MSVDDDTLIEAALERRNLLAVFATLPLFRELEPDQLDAIAREIEWFSVPGGATLFEAGESPDALYVVINGSLGAYVGSNGARTQLVGLISAGETVGEMALISGKARNATVVALRDTELARLPAQAFETLALRHPGSLRNIAKLIIQRLEIARGTARPRRATPKTIGVVPRDASVDATTFAIQLVECLNRIGRAQLVLSNQGAEQTSHWFHKLERANDFVVYVTDERPTNWSKLCLRQADALLLLARSANEPGPWPALEAVRAQTLVLQHAEVVLLHEERIRPRAARGWLDLHEGLRHHHVRSGTDVARVARLLTGRGIGLVLSGGGARGFGHVGVLRALLEAKVNIDAIGGTSIGAIIAAGWAAGWEYEEMLSRLRRSFVVTNPLNDYTLPLVSLIAGRKVGRLLRREFGDTEIEDLEIPYFCVSANLTTGQAAVHRRGELWLWLRASVAIPGVLPPVFTRRQVYVDGATISNLPVESMREVGGGPIIAVDVGDDRGFETSLETCEVPAFWNIPLWIRGAGSRINIMQILWRAGMINSAATTTAQRELTDLLLRPPLQHIDLLDWHAFDRAVELGYRHAAEVLERKGVPGAL